MPLFEIRCGAIRPAFELLPARMKSPEAELMLLAIGLQESNLTARRQVNGPARGLFQFEMNGGVRSVLLHKSSSELAASVCRARGVPPNTDAVYNSLEHDDVLAAAFARLLLWTDPKPLPKLGNVGEAWDLYNRVWRPGKPHRNRWDPLYARALEEVRP